jgi:outer membrane autotransporter protein
MLALTSAFALLFNPLVLAQEVPTGQPASDPTVNPPIFTPIFTPGSGPGQVQTLNPGDNPTYNPSEDPSNTLQIPSVDSKPTGGPSEETPSSPNLNKVPFGKPGNVYFHDSTKVEKTDGPPSTSKLDLLEKHSDLDAEKVLGLDTNELAEIDKIISEGGAGTDKAKKAVEIASKVKAVDGGSGDQGEKVLKLITDKNLDYNRLDKLDGNSLNLITKLTVDGNFDGETALKLAETGGEAGLKLATELNLDLDKLSKRNANEISLINSLGLDADKATKALVIAETAGENAEQALQFARDRKMDLNRLAARSANEISLLANIGVDDAKAEKALGIAEIGGEIGLNLVKDRDLDLDRLAARTKEEMVLLSSIGVDNEKAEKALSVAEKVGTAGLQLAQDVENLDIAQLDTFISIESTDASATTNLRNNLIKNLGDAATQNASKFKEKGAKVLAFSNITNSGAKDLIFEKLAVTTDASGGTVNPVEQLVLLDSKILDNIASVDKSINDLASSALDSLKNSAFASQVDDDISPDLLNVEDINSIFNHFDKLESTGLAGDANFEEVREQIASIIVLDVVSDAFQVEILNEDGTETPVQAPLQFSHVAEEYGPNVLAEIEGLTSSAAIVEEMNELNPSLFISHVQDNTDFDHHEDIKNLLSQNGRRATDTDESSSLTLIKEFQRDTIIDEVLKDYSSVLPVDKDAIQKILTPGNEVEEHHHKEAMNKDTPFDFAAYIDDIVPDELDSVSTTGQASFSNQLSNLKSRLSTVRLAQMGFPSSDGLIDAMVAKSMSQMEKNDLYLAQANGSLTKDILDKVLSEESKDYSNGFFVQASASFTEDKLHQMDGDSWGLTFGIDQEISEGIAFGLMGGFGKSDSSGLSTEVETDSFFAGIYGNKVDDLTFIEGFLTFGFHDSGTLRTESSGAVMESSPNSDQITIGLTYGKVMEYNGFLVTPSIGFTYDNFTTGAYSETVKSDPLGLAGASQMLEKYDESFVSTIGTKVNYYYFRPEGGALIPEFRLSWEHNFKADPVDQGVHLLSHGADDTYYINGRPEDSDYGFIGTGITSITKNGFSSYANYDYLIGKSDFDAHFINLGFRILF